MKTHMFHGYNVDHQGEETVNKLSEFLLNPVDHNYGEIGLFELHKRSEEIVEEVLPSISPGDHAVCHSHGAYLFYMLLEAGAPFSAGVLIQPALRNDTEFPENVNILCIHNTRDYTVLFSRAWSRLISTATAGKFFHGWGSAGFFGLQNINGNVKNWDSNVSPVYTKGHNDLFSGEDRLHWGTQIHNWQVRQRGH